MSETLSGAKGVLKINGTEVAFVSGVSVDISNTLTDIEVIGQLETQELVETGHKASATINVYKTASNNVAAVFGNDVGDLEAIIRQGSAILEVYNQVDDRLECVIQGVKFESGSGTMDARGVWTGSWTLRGIKGRLL
jgi:hypothetical protein